MNANSVKWDFGKKPIAPGKQTINSGLITNQPATPQDLAKLHGVALDVLLTAIHRNGNPLSPVGRDSDDQPLFDPHETAAALIAAGIYPTIRGI